MMLATVVDHRTLAAPVLRMMYTALEGAVEVSGSAVIAVGVCAPPGPV